MNEYYEIQPILKEGVSTAMGKYKTLEEAMNKAKDFLKECSQNTSIYDNIAEIRFYHTKVTELDIIVKPKKQ